MSEPSILIHNVCLVGGAVHFDATVAGHVVKLMFPDVFVEDEIGVADEAKVQAYFRDHGDGIRAAAWAAAYEHSTRGKSPNDPPGPVPYLGSVRKPYDQIRVCE